MCRATTPSRVEASAIAKSAFAITEIRQEGKDALKETEVGAREGEDSRREGEDLCAEHAPAAHVGHIGVVKHQSRLETASGGDDAKCQP